MRKAQFYLSVMLIAAFAVFFFASCTPEAVSVAPLPALESQTILVDSGESLMKIQGDEHVFSSLYDVINQGVTSIFVYTDDVLLGQGSGFLIDRAGHILTNYHVVEGADQIEITFANGYSARGELIGTDIDSDIAVIQADPPDEDIVPLPLGNSADIEVGQYVAAIGNPYGLSGTITVGIISARGRILDSLRAAPTGGFFTAADLIQTDAAINPGNSGGPLLNLDGEVIGINRAIRTEDNGGGTISNTGIGFAVPIDIVKRVVPYLIRDGKYDYPYLGVVSRETLSLIDKEALGYAADVSGAYVIDVSSGGPAEKAGLQGGSTENLYDPIPVGGDLIIAMDETPIRSFSDLLAYLVTYKSPGDTTDVTVLRSGEEIVFTVTLDKRPD